MNIANDPAYPVPNDRGYIRDYDGLTKRELFAAMAMQALAQGICKMDDFGIITNAPNDVAEIACTYADALIAELNKDQP